MARRHLGYGIDEWENLPWHHRQVYSEGLIDEFGDDSYLDEPMEPDDLAVASRFGLNVQQV